MSVAGNDTPSQCVILTGTLATRRRACIDRAPKPTPPVGGPPSLRRLIDNAARFGFRRFLLLAGQQGDVVSAQFPHGVHRTPGGTVTVETLIAPEHLGAGGALRFAAAALAPSFLMLDDDALFDVNYLSLCGSLDAGVLGRLALRPVGDAARYGGVAWLSRDILNLIAEDGAVWLEQDVFPPAIAQRRLQTVVQEGRLLDIDAHDEPRRGAVFFDRDGVLNIDRGYTYDIATFAWAPGAREAVRLANARGLYVFVVTNQSGVARGLYTEEDVRRLHLHMQNDLREIAAHIDDFRFCPHHPDAMVAAYAKDCGWRKPRPGMIHDLLAYWPVDLERSLLIGDKDSDLEAATAAGVRSVRTEGSVPLDALLSAALQARRA